MLVPLSAGAMEIEQLREIEGIRMIGARLSEVFNVYGLPAWIRATTHAGDQEESVVWHGTNVKLPTGDCEVVYEASRYIPGRGSLKWRNPRPFMPSQLRFLKRLVLQTKGKVGILTVRRAPEKTTYDVPSDPFQSHKISGARAEYRKPIPAKHISKHYGDMFEIIKNGLSTRKMRYWVLQRERETPLSLYAVDYELSENGENVMGFIVYSTESDFVLEKFQEYYARWEQNLND